MMTPRFAPSALMVLKGHKVEEVEAPLFFLRLTRTRGTANFANFRATDSRVRTRTRA